MSLLYHCSLFFSQWCNPFSIVFFEAASFVDGVFQRRGKRLNNRLLPEDVGIAKSAQVMGMIAFLILVWFVEKDGKRQGPGENQGQNQGH